MKRAIATLIGAAQPIIMAALGGFEFRLSPELSGIYVACLFMAGFVYSFPGWDEK